MQIETKKNKVGSSKGAPTLVLHFRVDAKLHQKFMKIATKKRKKNFVLWAENFCGILSKTV